MADPTFYSSQCQRFVRITDLTGFDLFSSNSDGSCNTEPQNRSNYLVTFTPLENPFSTLTTFSFNVIDENNIILKAVCNLSSDPEQSTKEYLSSLLIGTTGSIDIIEVILERDIIINNANHRLIFSFNYRIQSKIYSVSNIKLVIKAQSTKGLQSNSTTLTKINKKLKI